LNTAIVLPSGSLNQADRPMPGVVTTVIDGLERAGVVLLELDAVRSEHRRRPCRRRSTRSEPGVIGVVAAAASVDQQSRAVAAVEDAGGS